MQFPKNYLRIGATIALSILSSCAYYAVNIKDLPIEKIRDFSPPMQRMSFVFEQNPNITSDCSGVVFQNYLVSAFHCIQGEGAHNITYPSSILVGAARYNIAWDSDLDLVVIGPLSDNGGTTIARPEINESAYMQCAFGGRIIEGDIHEISSDA